MKAEAPSPSKGAVQPAPQLSFKEKISSYFKFLYDERFQKIVGLTLLLFSVFLAFSFVSFPFTWENDYSKVVGNLFSPEVKVENWFGKMGALISYIFIYKWFGVSSFVFPFLAFITGMRITFNVGPTNLSKIYIYSFFFLVFVSVTLGYIFTDTSLLYLGGAYGYTLSNMCNSYIGFAGTGLSLFFIFLVFLVIAYNVSFDLSKKANIEESSAIIEPIELKEEPKQETSKTNTLKEELSNDDIDEEPLIEEDPKHDIEEEVETPVKNEEIVLSSANEENQFTVESTEKKEEE